MPEEVTHNYELLLEETRGASTNEGFNYEAHIEATRVKSAPTTDPEPDLDPEPTEDPKREPAKIYEVTDPCGGPIAPIYLLNPPQTMPKKSIEDYELLLLETGGLQLHGNLVEVWQVMSQRLVNQQTIQIG